MQEMTYGIPQRIPSLVSLSTIAMATGFQYECPSGMFSLLCMEFPLLSFQRYREYAPRPR